MANPPSLAVGFLCILRLSFGISTAPILKASFFTKGVKMNDITKATINAIRILLFFIVFSP